MEIIKLVMDFLVTIGGVILEPVFNYMFAPLRHQLEYLFSYKDELKNLENQVQKLDAIISRIQSDTEQAKTEGNAIKGYVQDWQKDAATKLEEAKHFLEPDPDHTRARCSCRRPLPNLALRRRLSKKAKEMAEEIELVIGRENDFRNNISFRPALQHSFEQKDFEKFETRGETLREMMKALRNPEVRMIGLCGFGGMGKTMLVKEVARLAEEGNLFTKQILAVVSQNPGTERIQQQIADQLGLKFEKEDVTSRAKLLEESLKKKQKILIVLDDVWTKLDLFEVGIRFKDDNKEWKIILTSRSQEVCKAMGADEKTTFMIKSLTDEEAANLFNKIVGDIRPEFKYLATEVIGECGGLPLAIVTTASALQINKSLYFWRNALVELKRLPTGSKIYEKLYRCFKTSFDALGNEAKSLLLICSAHHEDENVSLEELTGYVMVLDLFGYVYTSQEASDRVESLVDNLKAYSLLSNGNYRRTVKVHDVIRDVAISIASELKKNPMYCLRESVRFEDCLNRENFKELYAISVPGGCGINDDQLPERLACPRLKLLMLSGLEITDRFFEETKELKALRLDVKGGKKLASSFRSLQNLKALHLRIWGGGDVDIAIIGELTNLLILDLSYSWGLVKLPKEIGNLSRLQVLNLNRCDKLKVIEPNVISRLVQLEELYMEDVGEINSNLVSEIKDLRKLRVLHLDVKGGDVDLAIIGELTNLLILDLSHSEGLVALPKEIGNLSRLQVLKLSRYGRSVIEPNVISRLVQLEELYMVDVGEINASLVSEIKDLRKLRVLHIEIPDVSFVPEDMFSHLNLERYHIRIGPNFGFPSRERSTRALKVFDVKDRSLLYEDGFQRLMKKSDELILEYMPGVSHIVNELDASSFQDLECLELFELENLESFMPTSIERPTLFNDKVVFNNLQDLTIEGCHSLLSGCALATFESLQQLKKLSIKQCDLIEEVLVITKEAGDHEETKSKKIPFPKLESLQLFDLPKLKRFGLCEADDHYTVEFSSLLKIDITHCPELRTFIAKFIPSMSTTVEEVKERSMAQEILFSEKVVAGMSFKNLQQLTISNCNNVQCMLSFAMVESLIQLKELRVLECKAMEQIVTKAVGEDGRLKNISFPKLEYVELEDLPKLKRFCEGDCIEFPSLLMLIIFDCYKLGTFIPNSHEERELMAQQPLFNEKVVVTNLTDLVVWNSHRLISLFNSSTATSLSQLKRVFIGKCDQMTQVIHVNDQMEDESAAESEISFSQLKILSFHRLPNLKCFHSGNNELQFPNLEKIILRECPEMKSFSHGTINTPKLNKLIIAIEPNPTRRRDYILQTLEEAEPIEELWEGDLNRSIRKLWDDSYIALQWIFSETVDD